MLFSNNWKGAGGTAWLVYRKIANDLGEVIIMDLLSASVVSHNRPDHFFPFSYILAQCKREKAVWLCDTTASVLQTTYHTFLTLQLFLQQKISSKTVAEERTLHPFLSILHITHINHNNFIVCSSATVQFCV